MSTITSLFAGIAFLVLGPLKAQAEQDPEQQQPQQPRLQQPAAVSNDSTAKWRIYTDQAAALGAKACLHACRTCTQCRGAKLHAA